MYGFYAKDHDKMRQKLSTPGYSGAADPFLCYYQKYKNLEKELEGQDTGYSPSTAYLSKVSSMKMIPSPLGLMVKKKQPEGTIHAKNLKMGGKYAEALSSSMKLLSNTQVLEMPGNRLGVRGGAAILGSLADRVR